MLNLFQHHLFKRIVYFCGVKRFLKISAVLSVSVLYCLMIGIYSGKVYNSNALSKSANQVIFTSSDSMSLFCNSERTESLASVHSSFSRTSFKNSFNQFSACPIAAGKLLFTKYLPYIYRSENLAIGFKPTDIIFPFHYFW